MLGIVRDEWHAMPDRTRGDPAVVGRDGAVGPGWIFQPSNSRIRTANVKVVGNDYYRLDLPF